MLVHIRTYHDEMKFLKYHVTMPSILDPAINLYSSLQAYNPPEYLRIIYPRISVYT